MKLTPVAVILTERSVAADAFGVAADALRGEGYVVRVVVERADGAALNEFDARNIPAKLEAYATLDQRVRAEWKSAAKPARSPRKPSRGRAHDSGKPAKRAAAKRSTPR